ncbi:hypothetical protein HK099_008609 [Clydaea vesicula]|uniref:Cytochrome b5 heme-binding domain-containing protein n=1 Tax=Clydaea vesicula TaxID=447962 RepID=A0AAD5XXU9_9FUNG|nr:hypothetical protein HK099_008609 [Clydaea vesicula]KAJ3378878.1 hypothetical protein HDU92_007062 [Lobulomyces angularis]
MSFGNIKPGEGPDLPPGDKVFTAAELAQYNGESEGKPIYLAVKGVVYDVTKSAQMYGPTGGYKNFAGKDASMALGKSSTKIEDCVGDYSTLSAEQLDVLNKWEAFFKKKYNILGTVARS